ncbi:MAG TPA: hypothetical protein VIS54_01430 [Psychromonas sp.]
MGNKNSQQFNNDDQAADEWVDDDWEDDNVISEDDEVSVTDIKEDQKKRDLEKAKIRRSIEEFREQKRLKELLGDDFDDFDY